jgi:hypothetical protein
MRDDAQKPSGEDGYFPLKNGFEWLLTLFWIIVWPSKSEWKALINLLEQMLDLIISDELTAEEMRSTLLHWDAFSSRMDHLGFHMPDLPMRTVDVDADKDREAHAKFSSFSHGRVALGLQSKEMEQATFHLPYVPMAWEAIFLLGTPGSLSRFSFDRASLKDFVSSSTSGVLPSDSNSTLYAGLKEEFDNNTFVSVAGRRWFLGVIYRNQDQVN